MLLPYAISRNNAVLLCWLCLKYLFCRLRQWNLIDKLLIWYLKELMSDRHSGNWPAHGICSKSNANDLCLSAQRLLYFNSLAAGWSNAVLLTIGKLHNQSDSHCQFLWTIGRQKAAKLVSLIVQRGKGWTKKKESRSCCCCWWWISFCSFRTKFGEWEDNCISSSSCNSKAASSSTSLVLSAGSFCHIIWKKTTKYLGG